MKTKIFFILASIFFLYNSCEKELYDPGYFEGPSLSLSISSGGFGINQDIYFDVIVNNGDNISEVQVTNFGGTNPIVPTPPVGVNTTPIVAQDPVTLPVALDPVTGKRIASFYQTKTELGLNATSGSKITLKASALHEGKEIFTIVTVTLTTDRFRVFYDGNGNTGGYVPMDKGFYSSTATLTMARNTEKLEMAGMKFTGWNAASDGSGVNFQPRQTVVMGASDHILYARWTSGPTYSIIYDGNGHDNGSVPYDENIYVEGDIVPVMSNTVYSLSKKGFEFRGWNTQADTLGVRYPGGSQTLVMPAVDTKLYAMWKSLF